MDSPLDQQDLNLSAETPWRRNLLIAALVLVFGGGTLFYFYGPQKEQAPFADSEIPSGGALQFDLTAYHTEPSSQTDTLTFVQDDLGVKLNYPSAWTFETISEWVPVLFLSPVGETTRLKETVALSLEDVSAYPDVTLKGYGDAAFTQLQAALPGYELLDQGERSLGQYEAGYLLGQYPEQMTQIKSNVLSVFAVVDTIVYVFTYTYSPDQAPLYEDEVDAMIESFELIESPEVSTEGVE